MRKDGVSRLLINESPLQVLPSLACQTGLNEAMFVQQLHYWLRSKFATEHDGEVWIYNTYESWQEQFPFWSLATVKRVIKSCEAQGIIKTSTQFNPRNGDRTKWYTLDYQALEVEDNAEDPQRISSEQQLNLTSATAQSDPRAQVNLTPALPETTQRLHTESTTDVVVDDPQRISSEALPDDETSRCLLLLSKVKGFPRDQSENALYLAELRAEFPDVQASEVCREYAVWHRDNPAKTRNYRSRLRSFFKKKSDDLAKERGNHPGRASPRRNGAAFGTKASSVTEGYEFLFGKPHGGGSG